MSNSESPAAPTALEINLVERVNVGDIVSRGADLHPQRVAVIDGERQTDYATLERQVNRLGHALLGLGLRHQDVVAVMARNCTELLVIYFACARAGLVFAPVNLGLQRADIAWCLRDSKAKVLIAQNALADAAQAVLAELLPDLAHRFWIGGEAPDGFDALLARGTDEPLETFVADRDCVQLLYTSGTTARPKGVLTSHLAVTIAGLANAIAHRCAPGVVTLIALPLFHCAMLNAITVPVLVLGGTVVLAQGFDAHEAAELFDRHSVQLVVLLPMMYGLLLAASQLRTRTFPAMKRAMYAMAPMAQERLHEIHAMFPNADVVLSSGQTEFLPQTCIQRPEHQWTKALTWGTATCMTRVAVMGAGGRLLPRGQTGELVYRGPQVMNGYLNQSAASLQSLRYGWFHSGDVAHLDEDGAIWFEDRLKDVIKTGGENVASVEVERCLLAHPAVADAAVVGVPHSRWGEAITAAVIRPAGASVDEATLLAHCRERLASFKVPKCIVFVDAFPRTPTGKIQKHVIRRQFAELFPT